MISGRPGGTYKVLFLMVSNGRSYRERLRTKPGIWFLDACSPLNLPYPVRNWFSPMMKKDVEKANLIIKASGDSFMMEPSDLNLRDYQIKAINKVNEAIIPGKPTALLAMATGMGKTRTVPDLIYKRKTQ